MRVSGFPIILLLLTRTALSTVIIPNDDPNKGHKVESDDHKVDMLVGAVEETPESETIFLLVDDTKHGGDLVSLLSAKLGDDGLSSSSKVDLGLAGVDGDLDQLKAVSKDLSELGESFKADEPQYGDQMSDSLKKEEHSLISAPTMSSSKAQTEKNASLLSTGEVFPASRPTMANRLAPTTVSISTTTGGVPTADLLPGKLETSKMSDFTVSSTSVPSLIDVQFPTATQGSAGNSQTSLPESEGPKPSTVKAPKEEMKSLQKVEDDLQTSNSQALEPSVPGITALPLAEASVTPVVAVRAEQPSEQSSEQSSSVSSSVIGESTQSEQTAHANTIGHVNMEKLIKDRVEEYLKEEMDRIVRHSKEAEENKEEKASSHANLTPSRDVRHAEISLPIGSGSNKGTSNFVSQPNHSVDPALESIGKSGSSLDLNLDDGLEHLNIERLKNVLKAVLNDAKDSNTLKPQTEVPAPFRTFPLNQAEGLPNLELNQIPESNQVYPHEHISEYSRPIAGNQREQSLAGNKRKPLSTFESVTYIKENLELLKAFVKNLDKVTTEGLSDKDNKDIKWSDYNLSRLKEIPQEVLEIILSEDKRQTFDNIVHRPFLKKIALDVTSLDENQIDLLIDQLDDEETRDVLSDEVFQQEEDKSNDDNQEQYGSDGVELDHDYSDVDEASEADENRARLVGEETFIHKPLENQQLEHNGKGLTEKIPTPKSFDNPQNLDPEFERPREKPLNSINYETSKEEDDGFKSIERSKARFVFDQKKRIGLRNKESEIEEEDIEEKLFKKKSSLQNGDGDLEDKDIASENANKSPTKTERSSERPTKTAQNSPYPKSISITPESLKEHAKDSSARTSSSSNRAETIKGKSTKSTEKTLLDKKSGTPQAVHNNSNNESLMEKFKKNPSLLFAGSVNGNKDGTSHGSGSDDSLFDFTRSSGHKNNVFRFENLPAYILFVLLVLAPFFV